MDALRLSGFETGGFFAGVERSEELWLCPKLGLVGLFVGVVADWSSGGVNKSRQRIWAADDGLAQRGRG